MAVDPSIPRLLQKLTARQDGARAPRDTTGDSTLDEMIARIRLQSPERRPDDLAKSLTRRAPHLSGSALVLAQLEVIDATRKAAQAAREASTHHFADPAAARHADALNAAYDAIHAVTADAWLANAKAHPSHHGIRQETAHHLSALREHFAAFLDAGRTLTEYYLTHNRPAEPEANTWERMRDNAARFAITYQDAAALLPDTPEPGKPGAGR